jgi:8-oxo-dGTP pyrophosphatase MutT (NUDIX family)
MPITSIGIIAFRFNGPNIEYLMICRKNTLGLIDFMRGKYSISNTFYILNMLYQMTEEEKAMILTCDFDRLWKSIWGEVRAKTTQYESEEVSSREKYNALCRTSSPEGGDETMLAYLVRKSNEKRQWTEAEWGFPKGRRNPHENDYDCAIREFCEETGYHARHLKNVQNIFPYEEIFTGSNYKSYKHRYYLMYMRVEDTADITGFERDEVSQMEWKTYENAMASIREYNVEKRRLLTNVHKTLSQFMLFYI